MKARPNPSTNFLWTGLFKNRVSIIAVKNGAVVPNKVAFAMEVNFTAPKKHAKWNPKNIPAKTSFNRVPPGKEPCGLIALVPQSMSPAVPIRQKAMTTAGIEGSIRTKIDEVLTETRATLSRKIIRRDVGFIFLLSNL